MRKLWMILTGSGLLALVLAILALSHTTPGAVSLAAAPPRPLGDRRSVQSEAMQGPRVRAYQLLTNPGLEAYDPPYGQFDGVDCQVATGWQRFWYGGPEPCWMDDRVFANSHLGVGWVDAIEGETSQLIFSTEPYTAGLWQQVSGLTSGVGYGFHAAMLTIYQTSAPPAVNGTMIKQVGLDPTGGTDPRAATVIWSEADDHDEGPWSVDLRAAALAQASTMTVFIRVTSPYPAGPWPFLNISFLDSAILAQTPVVTATSPAFSTVPTFTVSWDNAVPAPGGDVKKYDVQWLDEAEGVWHDWFTRTTSVRSSFVGGWRHAYRFRARAMQKYENGARLYSPYRPDGDTRTFVQGAKLFGRVLSHDGKPLGGATVAIAGTAYAATSRSDGFYELDTPPWAEPRAVTVNHPAWLSPAPLYGVTLGLMETMAFTWTLRPPDDAVVNGGFEAGLAGWSLAGASVGVSKPVHTGGGALALRTLGSAESANLTASASQSLVVTDAWEPALSFWYYPATGSTADRLNVVLTVVTHTASPRPLREGPGVRAVGATLPVTTTRVFTPALDVKGWTHIWYDVSPPEAALTGTVTVRFQLWDQGSTAATTVYLDEVSLGATWGGPYKIHLPLAVKRF